MSSTRSKDFLITPTVRFKGSQLPSNEEVLAVLLCKMQEKKSTIREVASSTIDEVLLFWEKARIPTTRKDHAVAKLEKLYTKYTLLKKGKNRRSQAQVSNEVEFSKHVKDLFDIAHADALTIIKIEEDKEFLQAQREPGRRGKMGNVDSKLAGIEARRQEREERRLKQVERAAAAESASHASAHHAVFRRHGR